MMQVGPEITMSGVEFFKLVTDELDSLINANTIMGDAIDGGDKIIIPIASFGFGFGGGMSSRDKKDEEKNDCAGAGAGGGVSPIAIVVMHKNVTGIESVQVISLKKNTALSEAIATVSEKVLPQVTETLKVMTQKKEAKQPIETAPPAEIPKKSNTV